MGVVDKVVEYGCDEICLKDMAGIGRPTFLAELTSQIKKKYPQGGEKQLIDAVVGRRVPSMGLPIDTGAVVQNVGTALAVYEAVQKNKPLFEGILTVTGLCSNVQKNYKHRVGTPISKIIPNIKNKQIHIKVFIKSPLP